MSKITVTYCANYNGADIEENDLMSDGFQLSIENAIVDKMMDHCDDEGEMCCSEQKATKIITELIRGACGDVEVEVIIDTHSS